VSQRRTLNVAIIGAGMSGLCMAVKLQDAGIDTYTIFETADEVGGTWRDNTYPGLTCDVPSRFYTYSFRSNPGWSHLLPSGPEIHAYFRDVATERGIRPHIRFGTEVTSAKYRDGQWWIATAAGEEPFDVLITATGFSADPALSGHPRAGHVRRAIVSFGSMGSLGSVAGQANRTDRQPARPVSRSPPNSAETCAN